MIRTFDAYKALSDPPDRPAIQFKIKSCKLHFADNERFAVWQILFTRKRSVHAGRVIFSAFREDGEYPGLSTVTICKLFEQRLHLLKTKFSSLMYFPE